MAQMEVICERLGTPNEAVWPGVSKLRDWFEPNKQIPPRDKSWWRREFAPVGNQGAELLSALLRFDPRQRVTARQALEHEYWASEPRPCEVEKLPRKGGGEKAMAVVEGKVPGEVDEKFRGVARKLF